MANKWKSRQEQLRTVRPYDPAAYPEMFGLEPHDVIARKTLNIMVKSLEGYLYGKPLMFRPDDDLSEIIGIDDDEISEIVREVMSALGKSQPSSPALLPKIRTAQDLLGALCSLQ